MRFSIDHIEGQIAVCEFDNGDTKEISLKILPDDVTEGIVIFCKNGQYFIDYDETEKRKKANKELLKKLFGEN